MSRTIGSRELVILLFMGIVSTKTDALYTRQSPDAKSTTYASKQYVETESSSWFGQNLSGQNLSARGLHREKVDDDSEGKDGGQSGTKRGNSSQGWVEDEYYGCLALSEEEISELRNFGRGFDCDYVVHAGNSGAAKANSSYSYTYNSRNDGGSVGGGSNGGNQTSSNYSTRYDAGGDNTNGDASEYTISYSNNQGEGESTQANDGDNTNAYAKYYSSYKDNESTTDKSNNTSSQGKKNGNEVVSSISDQTSPYNAFDISHCDTYEHLWTWDLEISCGQGSNYSECHCTFAESLFEKGLLSCDDAQHCPRRCSICSNCLRLLGCEGTRSSIFAGSIGSSSSAVTAAVAIFAALVGSGCCLVSRRKKAKRGKLNDHLMDDTSVESQDIIWSVPVDRGLPSDSGSSLKPVWLIPDNDSMSVDASSSTSSEAEMPYRLKGNVRFPDILGQALATDQVLPPRKVSSVPTDMTSQSDESSVGDERRQTIQQKATKSDHVGKGRKVRFPDILCPALATGDVLPQRRIATKTSVEFERRRRIQQERTRVVNAGQGDFFTADRSGLRSDTPIDLSGSLGEEGSNCTSEISGSVSFSYEV